MLFSQFQYYGGTIQNLCPQLQIRVGAYACRRRLADSQTKHNIARLWSVRKFSDYRPPSPLKLSLCFGAGAVSLPMSL